MFPLTPAHEPRAALPGEPTPPATPPSSPAPLGPARADPRGASHDGWFRQLVEQFQDILTVLADDGRILYDSPAVARVLGYAQGELVGRNAFELVHPEDVAAALDLLVETIASPGTVASLVFRFRHRDGSWRCLESVGTALQDGGGSGLVITSRDVTGRRPAAPGALAGVAAPPAARHIREHAAMEMIERLAGAAELRDDETGKHTRRVGDLSASLAAGLGLGPAEVEEIRRAAPLHDIGKIGIPDAILRKPGALSAEERAVMRTHTSLGARLLAGGDSPLLRTAEQIALCHHERWDGSGYPANLHREAIPLPARIVAVADCYDALTHERPYRGPLSHAAALDEIRGGAGSHFDPGVADAFLRLHPAGAPQIREDACSG